jgi:segregation and condensation protein B
MTLDPQHVRMAEALLFASAEPLTEAQIAARLPEGAPLELILGELAARYEAAGVVLVQRGRHWLFQTAPDLAFLLRKDVEETRKLSRAAVETLAVVAYHQHDRRGRMKGVSRAEIEDIRGVSLSRGTLDLLIEAQWVKPVGRRPVPGRPVVYGTTEAFLAHFGLTALGDLPGLEDLRAAGMLDPFEQSLAELMSRDTEPDEPMLPLEDIEAQAGHDLPDLADGEGAATQG